MKYITETTVMRSGIDTVKVTCDGCKKVLVNNHECKSNYWKTLRIMNDYDKDEDYIDVHVCEKCFIKSFPYMNRIDGNTKIINKVKK